MACRRGWAAGTRDHGSASKRAACSSVMAAGITLFRVAWQCAHSPHADRGGTQGEGLMGANGIERRVGGRRAGAGRGGDAPAPSRFGGDGGGRRESPVHQGPQGDGVRAARRARRLQLETPGELHRGPVVRRPPARRDDAGPAHKLRLYSISSASFGEGGNPNHLATTVKRLLDEHHETKNYSWAWRRTTCATSRPGTRFASQAPAGSGSCSRGPVGPRLCVRRDGDGDRAVPRDAARVAVAPDAAGPRVEGGAGDGRAVRARISCTTTS